MLPVSKGLGELGDPTGRKGEAGGGGNTRIWDGMGLGSLSWIRMGSGGWGWNYIECCSWGNCGLGAPSSGQSGALHLVESRDQERIGSGRELG